MFILLQRYFQLKKDRIMNKSKLLFFAGVFALASTSFGTHFFITRGLQGADSFDKIHQMQITGLRIQIKTYLQIPHLQ